MKRIEAAMEALGRETIYLTGVGDRHNVSIALRAAGVDPDEEMPTPAPQATGEEFKDWWQTSHSRLTSMYAAVMEAWDESARRARVEWEEERAHLLRCIESQRATIRSYQTVPQCTPTPDLGALVERAKRHAEAYDWNPGQELIHDLALALQAVAGKERGE